MFDLFVKSPQRDNQRSRVYAWERRAVADLTRNSLYTADFSTLQECIDFAEPIWRKERARMGLAKSNAPRIERPSWGQKRALSHHDHRITLPRWTRSRWIILHELAHRLTPGDEVHGPRFVGCLIGLVSRWLDYDAQQLMALADDMCVKYHIRTIGAVPIRGLAWHVERILKLERPMSAMDLACHLSLSEGVAATDRTVRAASLSLIRRGDARWLRGKLHPTPRNPA